VLGKDYANNDHVALPTDLALITAAGYRIVPLDTIVMAVEACQRGHDTAGTEVRYAGITFDDGPAFDVEDFVHPRFGFQRSFLGIMQDFAQLPDGKRQPALNATSFVIASPEARRAMEETFDTRYTYIAPGSLGDGWWHGASSSGLISIGNHSWDHLHPGLAQDAESMRIQGDFTQVTTDLDADKQILRAAEYIATRTNGRSVPFFAYPFGHYNEFLTERYFPARRAQTGLRAAFTGDPKPITGNESVWCLPRYVCGHHWTSPDELLAILGD